MWRCLNRYLLQFVTPKSASQRQHNTKHLSLWCFLLIAIFPSMRHRKLHLEHFTSFVPMFVLAACCFLAPGAVRVTTSQQRLRPFPSGADSWQRESANYWMALWILLPNQIALKTVHHGHPSWICFELWFSYLLCQHMHPSVGGNRGNEAKRVLWCLELSPWKDMQESPFSWRSKITVWRQLRLNCNNTCQNCAFAEKRGMQPKWMRPWWRLAVEVGTSVTKQLRFLLSG